MSVGGCDAVELARCFGTPLWVIDEQHFRHNCQTFRRAFRPELFPGGLEVIYASKALLSLAVCRIVHLEGLSLDVVSGGELHTARAAGFPMERVYLHGNNKSPAEIAEALAVGVGRVVVDNHYELEVLERLASERSARGVQVMLRLAPGVEVRTHDYVKTGQTDSKFGLPIEDGQALAAVKRVLASPRLTLKGFHCHLGSQILEVQPFVRAAEAFLRLAGVARDQTGWVPAEIDLGGGFGVRYVNGDTPLAPAAYAEAISRAVLRGTADLGLPVPRVLVEPGRAICATAGWTLYTVGSSKRIPGVRTYVAVDGGLADNPRPALYHARHEACLANRAGGGPAEGADAVTVVGKCCESGDVLLREARLPRPAPGDVLAVSCTGAYNYTMSMNYNRLPRPAMVLVGGGRAEVIVERESYADLIARERIPERLDLTGRES